MSENGNLLDAVYRENELLVRKLCRFKLKSCPNEIDDCIQETFTAFAVALDKGEEIKNPKAWLLKVANNIIKDLYSKNAKHKSRIISLNENTANEDFCYSMTLEQPSDLDEETIEIYKEYILELLSEDERNLIYDRYELNKSIKTMASERGTTENNMYQKFSRLKIKTKMLISKALDEQNAQKQR